MKRGGRRNKNRNRKRGRGARREPVAFVPAPPEPQVEIVVTDGPGAGDVYVFTSAPELPPWTEPARSARPRRPMLSAAKIEQAMEAPEIREEVERRTAKLVAQMERLRGPANAPR